MGNRYKRIVGWEKLGGEWLLRMELAEPRLAAVWPGPPSIEQPKGELRKLTDEVLPLSDVQLILSDDAAARQREISSNDVVLLYSAWNAKPGTNSQQRPGQRREYSGPDLV